MKVYILFMQVPYESDCFIGVYATEQAAEEAKKRESQRWHGDRFFIEEHSVQVGEEGTNSEA